MCHGWQRPFFSKSPFFFIYIEMPSPNDINNDNQSFFDKSLSSIFSPFSLHTVDQSQFLNIATDFQNKHLASQRFDLFVQRLERSPCHLKYISASP